MSPCTYLLTYFTYLFIYLLTCLLTQNNQCFWRQACDLQFPDFSALLPLVGSEIINVLYEYGIARFALLLHASCIPNTKNNLGGEWGRIAGPKIVFALRGKWPL